MSLIGLRWMLTHHQTISFPRLYKSPFRTFAQAPKSILSKPSVYQFMVQTALDSLRQLVEQKNLPFCYNDLNNLPQNALMLNLDSFSEKALALLESKSKKTIGKIDLDPFINPTFELLPEIVRLLKEKKYPKEFLKCRGLETESDILCDVLANLFVQYYSGLITPFFSRKYEAVDNWNLLMPEQWFPEARKMRRKIIMHVGPTNSGKTYQSLQKFAKAKSGYYAGPLRMLAREVYEKFNAQGVSCNLITGEEIIPSIDESGVLAGLSSGTVEMVPMKKHMDICIIDEIQMIADPQRGCAWTNAILGVLAKEVHLCGEERSVELIKRIAETTGEELEINHYKRLGLLKVMDKPLTKLENLKSGDCIVLFSKLKILDMKQKIEATSNLKVGVIYGALPPEVRLEEVAKFNIGKYDVLVASDAIGMGINLRIKRVIFGDIMKFDGSELHFISDSSVKQIGGRAGRYAAIGGKLQGLVTAFRSDHLRFVKEAMKQNLPDIKKAGLWPTKDFWWHYLSSVDSPQKQDLTYAFDQFTRDFHRRRPGNYFLLDLDHQARLLGYLKLKGLDKLISLDDQLRFAQLPLSSRHLEPGSDSVQKILLPIIKKTSMTLFDMQFHDYDIMASLCSADDNADAILERLAVLERNHHLTLNFLWLSQRWPALYIDKASASQVKQFLEKRISEELAQLRQTEFGIRKNFSQFSDSKFRKHPCGQAGKQGIKTFEKIFDSSFKNDFKERL